MNKSTFRSIRKISVISGIIILVLALLACFYLIYPMWGYPFNAQRHGNPPLTPVWALEPWLWEDDVNTAAFVDELLDGYAAHDIPVRTILIDSPWSYRYNDFKVDTTRYPNPENWFGALQDQGYRVVLWMTTMVNSFNKDLDLQQTTDWFESVKSQGYLMADGAENKWWKGKGGFIDYTNPDALKWWQQQQDQVLRLGIDGWKLDGTATLCWTNLGSIPFFYKKSSQGWITTRKYMDLYYRHEYEYGLTRNPEFVTLSRSMDRGYHPEGFAPIDAAPVTWVGDQEHKWLTSEMLEESAGNQKDIALKGVQGFESAIDNILKAAAKGYSVIGSDIAGFSGKTIPPRLYIRWTQFSAFCGLFMNGGHGERRLWKRSDQELEIIRKFTWLHQELIPYMYHYVVTGHQGGPLLQTPVSGKHHFLFGEDILVAPIFEDRQEWTVTLPPGQWHYWFDPTEVLEGPVDFTRDYSLSEFPVFIRAGAIIPMNIERSYTGIGTNEDKGYLTVMIFSRSGEKTFEVFRENEGSTVISYEKTLEKLRIGLSGEPSTVIFKIYSKEKPAAVSFSGEYLGEGIDYFFDQQKEQLLIRNQEKIAGNYLVEW